MTKQQEINDLVELYFQEFTKDIKKDFAVKKLKNSISLKEYYSLANVSFSRVSEFEVKGDKTNCFGFCKKYCIFAVEIIPKHRDFLNEIYYQERTELRRQRDKAYLKLFDLTQEIKDEIKQQIEEFEKILSQEGKSESINQNNQIQEPSTKYLDDTNNQLKPINYLTQTDESPPIACHQFGSYESPPDISTFDQNLSQNQNSPITTEKYLDHHKKKQKNSFFDVLTFRSFSSYSKSSYFQIGNAIQRQEDIFKDQLEKKDMFVVKMPGDGNCLFRGVAHQIFGDDNKHAEIRSACCNYMWEHQDRFASMCDSIEAFREYIEKRRDPVSNGKGEWGDDPEIRAIEEMFDRPIEIWSVEHGPTEPLPINLGDENIPGFTDATPIRLSYHRQNHYNSITFGNASNWTGLGLRDTNLLRDSRNHSTNFSF